MTFSTCRRTPDKSTPFYVSHCQRRAVRSLVEAGVARGGSTVFLHELLERPQMVCIDRSTALIPLLAEYCAANSDVSRPPIPI